MRKTISSLKNKNMALSIVVDENVPTFYMYGAKWAVDYNLVEIKVYILNFIKMWIISHKNDQQRWEVTFHLVIEMMVCY